MKWRAGFSLSQCFVIGSAVTHVDGDLQWCLLGTTFLSLILQGPNAYGFIWISSDLVSLAIVIVIFSFQK